MKYFLAISKLNKAFNKQVIFLDAELRLPRTGLIGLSGPSGSGKSSLLRIVGGLDSNYKGSVIVNNISLKSLNEHSLRNYRINNVGFIFQDYPLLNQESVLDNTLILLNAISKEGKAIKEKKAKNLLRKFNVFNKCKEKAKNLSGGEKQRVASSLCFSSDAKLILADEPTASLDEENGKRLFEALKSYSKNHLVIVSSHNKELLQLYCDDIYVVKNKKIELEQTNNIKKEKIDSLSTYLASKKEKIGLSFLDRLKIAYKDLVSKKVRFLLTFACCFSSFCFIGFSSYIRFSMEKEVGRAVSTFSIPNQLIVSKKYQSNPTLYPCDEINLSKLYNDYKDEIRDYGYYLNFDFASLFKTDDSCFILTPYKTISLPYFSSRHINEFIWLDESYVETFPSDASAINDDELILGLPYDYMHSLCLQLKISRDYQSLGTYLSTNSIRFLLNVENDEIEFDDQELFTIKGVVKTDLPLLFNSSSKWNKTIFVDKMKFRMDETGTNPNPQYIYQIPFLYLVDKGSFYKKIKDDDRYSSLYFEPNSSSYMTSTCDSSFCLTSRVYVYKSNTSRSSDTNTIIDTGVPYLGLQRYGFYGSNESIFTGLLPQFFLSPSLENLNAASEIASIAESFSFDSIPNNVLCGNILSPFDKKVKIAAIPSSLKSNKPNDAYISKGLQLKLGKSTPYFFSYEASSYTNRDKTYRTMKNGSINIIDVIDNSDSIIYLPPSFFEEYLFSNLDVFTYNLEKSGYVLFFQSQKELLKTKDYLEKKMEGYYFLNADEYVSSSMNQTTSYVGSILLFSSLGTSILSLLLFGFIMFTNYEDDKNVRKLFFSLGLPKKEGFCFFFYKSLILILSSALLSSLLMIPLLALGSKIIGKSLNSSLGFSFSFEPFLSILLALLLYIVSALLIQNLIEKSENRRPV